jgi:hypothetical protein
MAQAQMTLEKLSIGQIMDIEKRWKESALRVPDRIYVMTAEELELYKGNCHEYIANAQEAIEKSKSDQVKKGQESIIKKYQSELELVEVELKKIAAESEPEKAETSTAQVELIDGQIVYLGVMEMAKYLGWSKQRVSASYYRGNIEAPAARVGNRPLWTPSQARKIKEKHV